MRNILTIFNKEIRSYFASPIAYGLMAFFAVISGYFFYMYVALFVRQGMEAQMMGRGFPMNVNEWVIRPVLMNLSVLSLFVLPMITMRLFAEEKARGTIELLATSPVKDWHIIVGKWLAALVVWAAILAVSLLNVLMLFFYGQPDLSPILTGYLGLLLLGGTLLAIGTFISNTTRNQIIAAVATFAVGLLLWVFDWADAVDQNAVWAKVMSYLSIVSHFEPFAKGVIDSKDFIFYLSVIFFGLFLTARSMESLRWRA